MGSNPYCKSWTLDVDIAVLQLFWEKRLQGLRACDSTEEALQCMELPRNMNGKLCSPRNDHTLNDWIDTTWTLNLVVHWTVMQYEWWAVCGTATQREQ